MKKKRDIVPKSETQHESFRISEDFFKQIIDSLEDYAVITTDIKGMISSWNSGAKNTFNYSENEVIGKDASILFTGEDVNNKELDRELRVAKEKGRAVDERFHVRKDGSLFWASGLVFPLKDHSGVIRGFTKVMRDRTSDKRAANELKESELRFRSLADTAPMYIAMADETGNAVYFNKPWLEFTGKKMDEMRGLGWLSTLHPEDAPKFERDFKNAFMKQIPINEQYRFRRADGKYRWMFAVGAPRFTPDGKFIGYFGTYTDFHELKKAQLALEESEQRFRVVSDNATTGLLIMNEKHHCSFMNPAAEDITGYTFEEIKAANKPLHEIVHYKKSDGTPYPMTECPIDRAQPEKNQTRGEDMFVRPDGSMYPVAFTASPIHQDGKVVGTVIELRDTTQEKKAEEKRRYLEKQKDEFIGIASHELKTPVTSIKAYAQVLERMFRKSGDIKSAEYVAKMDTQINRLSLLIADLLDVTKIQTGKLQFNEGFFDFNELIDEIVDDLQLTTDRHRLIKELSTTKSIYGDRDRIGQVLSNLITNAIKYSPRADKVIIATTLEKDTVRLCVQDFGVGIPKNKQDKVFKQFYRVSGDEEITFPGLGLGLYISSEIIKRQGGEIWVESALNKGSTFCFRLPIHKKAVSTNGK